MNSAALSVAEGLLCINDASAGELAPALRQVAAEFPERFATGGSGYAVAFRKEAGPEGFRVEPGVHGCEIFHTSTPAALRGLSVVMGALQTGSTVAPLAEQTPFPKRGVMVDTSRNGVPRLATLERLLRRMALMGLNRLYLYCEDTIRIPGEPFMGYFRGGYTQAELRALDDEAARLGIEVVPCIQVLGHMEQVLQWPTYWPLRDTPKVLLADEPQTYAMLERLIAGATAPFRSKCVHIGMDEAHGIGSGVYRQRNGQQRPFDILASHLAKVAEICQRQGLEPMIWSDMFFRLGSRTNHYYDREIAICKTASRQIPENVRLVYWDYYHYDEAFYDAWIARHQQLGQTPVFATGVWTWNRFWTELPHTFATVRPGMNAARKHGLTEVFATLWGDDGSECDLLSALPGVEFFAAHCFATPEVELPARFQGSCNADWAAWCGPSALDDTARPMEGEAGNLSKLLLWHDPLLGFLEKHLPPHLAGQYRCHQAEWEEAARLPGDNARLRHPARLAKVLALKAELHATLRPAYQRGESTRLRALHERLLPALLEALARLHESHRRLWFELYQPFGWDVLDRRYGGLRSRLETLATTLGEHLQAGTPIPELELEPLAVASEAQWGDVIISHARTASPSAIA